MSDQISAVDQGNQIHHALEKQVPPHEAAHTAVIGILGKEKAVIAFFKFLSFYLFIGEGLDNADAGQGILKACIYIADPAAVIHKGYLHSAVLSQREQEHADNEKNERKSQPPVNEEEKDKGANNFDQGNKQVFRSVVGEFCNIKQIGNQLAHHLAGVVAVVVGKRQPLIVVKELLAHIPLHLGAHHVSLIADVIFAQALDHIHGEEPQADGEKSSQDDRAVLGKQSSGKRAENLGIEQIHSADHCRTEEIQKKYGLVRPVVMNKSFQCIHGSLPCR